ncbi:MAG: PEP-CTERM sorting domain-containing protein [Phycisphaeraceae bacterium]|nr:PEP-CTERM sorting domain-containing protein [Phycisphaeraceae bacterium]
MSKLAKKLDAHFVAVAAAAGAAAMGAAQKADAAIVYSGVVNIPIASSTNGLYLNVVTGVINEPGNTTGATVPGWDINPWSSTALNFFNPAAPAGGVYVQRVGGGGTANLPVGEIIGAAPSGGRLYGASTAATTGNDPFVLNSADNIVGFRFQNEANGNATHYGWFRVSLSTTLSAQPRLLVEYAYEDVAGADIAAGAIPAPGSLALLALGAVGVAGRRRK